MKHILACAFDLLFDSGSRYHLTPEQPHSYWRKLHYEFSAAVSEKLVVTFLETGEKDNMAQLVIENLDESPIVGIHFARNNGPFLVPEEVSILGELRIVLEALEQAKEEAKRPELWNESGWFKP